MNKEHPYFEIFNTLKRGFLSVWLNHRSLLPMATFPVFVMFFTLMAMNSFLPDEPSYFVLALAQLPADFAIGMYSAFIILIIMAAPKRKKGDKPMMFTMNVTEHKGLLFTGAVAHMVVNYLSMGGLAIMNKFAAPLHQALETESTIPTVAALGLIISLSIGLYAVRFTLLPILLIGKKDVPSFYKQNMQFGLSVPVFFVKFLTMTAASAVILIPLSMIAPADAETVAATTLDFNTVFISFVSSCATVFAHIWAYATLAIGVRVMTEGPLDHEN